MWWSFSMYYPHIVIQAKHRPGEAIARQTKNLSFDHVYLQSDSTYIFLRIHNAVREQTYVTNVVQDFRKDVVVD